MIKRIIIVLAIYVVLCIPFNVFAVGNLDTYINSQGVEMTMDEYWDLKQMFSDVYIDCMMQDEFDEKMDLGIDFDNVQHDKKYIRIDHNHLTGQTTTTEISEFEYLTFGMNQNQNAPQATYIETSLIWIDLSASYLASGDIYFSHTSHWKQMPTVRSFDVSAVRWINLDIINGTQEGKQFYTLNGINGFVNYAFNGTNINNQNNGFGISMNLLNDPDVTMFELEISAILEVLDYPVFLFSTYQHAESSVTLAESKNYVLQSGGLGNVIHYLDNTYNKYDGMTGLYTYFMS